MSNLITIPQEDGFKTSLSQEYSGGLGTLFLQSAPTFTMPVGETSYATIQPNGENAYLVEFDSIDTINNTINITNVTLLKGASINNPTGITYPTNTEVIISDNYQFWLDIQTAVNSKVGLDETNVFTASNTFEKVIITEEGLASTIYVDEAARDADLGGNGAAAYAYTGIQAGGVFYNYNTSTAQWESIETGTATPNASEIVAGKIEIATKIEAETFVETGTTGAKLGVLPTQMNPLYYDARATLAETDGLLVTAGGQQYGGTISGLREVIPSSSTEKGTIEIATNAEVDAGNDTERAVTPQTLWQFYGRLDSGTTGAVTGGVQQVVNHALGYVPRKVTIQSSDQASKYYVINGSTVVNVSSTMSLASLTSTAITFTPTLTGTYYLIFE